MKTILYPAVLFLAALFAAVSVGHSLDEADRLRKIEQSTAVYNGMVEDIPLDWKTRAGAVRVADVWSPTGGRPGLIEMGLPSPSTEPTVYIHAHNRPKASPSPEPIHWSTSTAVGAGTLFIRAMPEPSIVSICTGAPDDNAYDYRYCGFNLRHGGSLRLDRETGTIEHCAGTLKGYEDIESEGWCAPLTVSKTGG